MNISRRFAILSLAASASFRANSKPQQFPGEQPERRLPFPDVGDEDKKLPNGKSQKDAMAREKHEQALKDASELVTVAEQLRDELKRAGEYVVPVSSVRKTEQIEKLAKKIRGRLQS